MLEMDEFLKVVDYFIILTASSSIRAQTILETIDKKSKELKLKKFGLSGNKNSDWLLLDLGDIIVHIFSEKGRDFYRLEKLWGNAPRYEFTTNTSS